MKQNILHVFRFPCIKDGLVMLTYEMLSWNHHTGHPGRKTDVASLSVHHLLSLILHLLAWKDGAWISQWKPFHAREEEEGNRVRKKTRMASADRDYNSRAWKLCNLLHFSECQLPKAYYLPCRVSYGCLNETICVKLTQSTNHSFVPSD